MKTINNIFLLLLSLGGVYGEVAGWPEKIYPAESLLQKLKQFHKATESSGNPKPTIKDFEKPRRHFVAKMHSIIFNRYFSFKDDEDVEVLIQNMQQGFGDKIEWLYYDQEEGECTISIAQIAPNAVVITDDTEKE